MAHNRLHCVCCLGDFLTLFIINNNTMYDGDKVEVTQRYTALFTALYIFTRVGLLLRLTAFSEAF